MPRGRLGGLRQCRGGRTCICLCRATVRPLALHRSRHLLPTCVPTPGAAGHRCVSAACRLAPGRGGPWAPRCGGRGAGAGAGAQAQQWWRARRPARPAWQPAAAAVARRERRVDSGSYRGSRRGRRGCAKGLARRRGGSSAGGGVRGEQQRGCRVGGVGVGSRPRTGRRRASPQRPPRRGRSRSAAPSSRARGASAARPTRGRARRRAPRALTTRRKRLGTTQRAQRSGRSRNPGLPGRARRVQGRRLQSLLETPRALRQARPRRRSLREGRAG